MTRSVSSVRIAKIILSTIIGLVVVNETCAAVDAKGDWAFKDFQKEHLDATKQKELQSKLQALTMVPGQASNKQLADVALIQPELLAAKLKQPKNTVPQAAAHAQAQGNQAGNNAADIAREQAIQSIDYCARYMKNFTTEGGNRWNKYRDNFFIPMALLLILPGAVLTQVRAIIAQGNPVIVGQASPLEGIQRAIIGIFLVPSTYLVVNYSIDLGNSIQYTICSEYKRIQGTDMYEDAMCAEIRAFGVRYLAENESGQNTPVQDESPRGKEPFAKLEGKLWGKLADPCMKLLLVPRQRDDASMSQGAVGTRMMMNLTNAGINTAWSILTAFQMAFMYYLFFVGPIMAALWTWPMKIFKDALPAWIEGVVTLAFWSFFWNVVILIIALTKSEASTGLFIVSACNFLATASVKYAFDFAGMLKGAATQAESMGAKAASKASNGGEKGGKRGDAKGGKRGKSASGNPPEGPASTSDQHVAANTVQTAAASLIPKPKKNPLEFDEFGNPVRKPTEVPKILMPNQLPTLLNQPIVITSLPPSEMQAGRDPAQLAGIDPRLLVPSSETNLAGPSINSVTNTFNDPLPASPGAPVTRAKNTVVSTLGNSNQQIMDYPRPTGVVDPDQVPLSAPNKVEEQAARKIAIDESIIKHAPKVENVAEESEMQSNVDPRLKRLEEERFSFTPPPMVETNRSKSFEASMAVADIPLEAQTCSSLLARMTSVVCDSQGFAPPEVAPHTANLSGAQATQLYSAPQDKPAASFAKELAKVYAAHMSQELAEQEAFRQTAPAFVPVLEVRNAQRPSVAGVITVVDSTSLPTSIAHVQEPQPMQQATVNTSLGSILSNLTLAKAPINPNVSNSWFTSAAEEVEII